MDLVQKEEAMVPASSLASTAVCLERWLGRMVEVPVAVLTALEVLILLAGVISRYLFHNPLVWSDELASILFLCDARCSGSIPPWRAYANVDAGCERAATLAHLLRSFCGGGSDRLPCPDPAFEH
jgi:hypothetical protein